MYDGEKLCSVRSLVAVDILNFQRDLVVMRVFRIELIICSTSTPLGTVELHLSGRWLSGTPFIRTLVIRNSIYPDRLGPSAKHFLTVIVLYLLWLKFFPSCSSGQSL